MMASVVHQEATPDVLAAQCHVQSCLRVVSRPVAGVLVTESAVLGVYVKRLKREKKRGAGSSS